MRAHYPNKITASSYKKQPLNSLNNQLAAVPPKIIYKNLEQIRKENNLTKQQFSKLFNYKENTYKQYHSHNKPINPNRVKYMLEKYNYNYEMFVSDCVNDQTAAALIKEKKSNTNFSSKSNTEFEKEAKYYKTILAKLLFKYLEIIRKSGDYKKTEFSKMLGYSKNGYSKAKWQNTLVPDWRLEKLYNELRKDYRTPLFAANLSNSGGDTSNYISSNNNAGGNKQHQKSFAKQFVSVAKQNLVKILIIAITGFLAGLILASILL